MPIVFEDNDLPGGGGQKCAVEVELWGAGRPIAGKVASSSKIISGVARPEVDELGQWSLNLVGNDDILPLGTTYRVSRSCTGCDNTVSFVSVPVTGGPFDVRSVEVDPMNTIAPGNLAVHASDLNLHGGGLELDYAELTTSPTVTGNSLAAAAVPGCSIEIPDLPRPIRLWAKVALVRAAGSSPTSGYAGIYTGGFGIFNSLTIADDDNLVTGSTNPKDLVLTHRLAAHSGGTYALGASGTGGNFTVVLDGSRRPSIWAVSM